MPGTRLNKIERRLLIAWDKGEFGEHPQLKSISITTQNGSGLRGIHNMNVVFNYPVTFLSGQNGSGKTTVLALAALGFHGEVGHLPTNAKSFAGRGTARFGYYTFKDFFHRGPGDADFNGVQIKWEYSSASAISISKQSDKWMRYERRPARPVEFLGLSRAVPAIELSTLRNQFGVAARLTSAPLDAEAREHLEHILGRRYPRAEVLDGRRYKLRRSADQGGYTSFNMGTGEDALFGLLARLVMLPRGSIVIIDELETGLHPAAQKCVAQALINIAWDRRLQIIASTHSHHILDQIPREARILLSKEADFHRVVSGPSALFALSEMSGDSHIELNILCEDEFAAGLIARMLPKAIRRRVSIKSCGSNNELANQAQSFARLIERVRCLIVWDGDVTDAEANRFLQQAELRYPHPNAKQRISWTRMPGRNCPEYWALEIAKGIGLEAIRNSFGFENQAETAAALDRCGMDDPHSIPYELAQQVGLSEEDVSSMLASCIASVVTVERDALIESVSDALNSSTQAFAA